MTVTPAIPITILTGFLGSGKTTIILNLIPQLPSTYKLALLKNEFGDLAIDSKLASESAISGVQELLNGCICCNLVGQLGEALETLRQDVKPDRIIVETSGSAFPATLAMEVNRLARETGHFVLDGVISVIDVENWQGYEDTSYTAKLQVQYTDLIVFNKWESCDERRFDACLDRVNDLEVDTAWVKSDRGMVSSDILLGIDGALARKLGGAEKAVERHDDKHEHVKDHQSEVEVLAVTLASAGERHGIDLEKLETFLLQAPKDEIYRIKAVFAASSPPASSDGSRPSLPERSGMETLSRYILNWAFARWTITPLSAILDENEDQQPALRMTIVCARYESGKWKKRLEAGDLVSLEGGSLKGQLKVERIS